MKTWWKIIQLPLDRIVQPSKRLSRQFYYLHLLDRKLVPVKPETERGLHLWYHGGQMCISWILSLFKKKKMIMINTTFNYRLCKSILRITSLYVLLEVNSTFMVTLTPLLNWHGSDGQGVISTWFMLPDTDPSIRQIITIKTLLLI